MANHIPYGYRIENGTAVIDESQAEQIKALFQGYLSGLALMASVKAAGLNVYHCGAKHMMQNRHYLGDDFYPQIIETDIFQKAEEEMKRRAKALGRVREQKTPEERKPEMRFTLKKTKKKYADPFKQAAYLYSQIEGSGVNG